MGSISFKNLALQILCPPGNGVFTVNTAKERKELLHQKLYQSVDLAEEKWKSSLKKIENWDKAFLLGICSDTGGGILRGANWGPLFLRLEMLKNPSIADDFFDLGDVRVIPHLLHDKYLNEETIQSCRRSLYGDENSKLPVSPLSMTEFILDHFYRSKKNARVFAIGGDHSTSYPLVKAWLRNKNRQNIKTGLLHFDAHTDLLVERMGIDLCFGSWVTHVLDDLPSKGNCYQVGIRSSGKEKAHWEKTFGVQQFWTKEIKGEGPEEIAERVVEDMKAKGIQEIYVSFDIDTIDARYASATGTPEALGLEPHEVMIMLRKIAGEIKITGADIMEIAPFLATGLGENDEPHVTLETGAMISNFLIKELNKNGDC